MAKESILFCRLMGVAVAAIMTGYSGGYTPTAAPNIVQVTSKGTSWNFTVENATNLTLVQTTVVSKCMNKVPPNRMRQVFCVNGQTFSNFSSLVD